uniref:Uncharacterized protein n=1 Tax=Rhizophora mucronata TaxID=61149 RepID=A0A2P2Q7D1_RHIMU
MSWLDNAYMVIRVVMGFLIGNFLSCHFYVQAVLVFVILAVAHCLLLSEG